MSGMKKEFRWFSIMDYDKEGEYLSERHREGWKFYNVTFPGIYTFERCEPEDVIYQLDYNKEGKKNQDEYVQMFKDCGWEYVMDFNGYSYFRKPVSQMQQKEEIFCDDMSRLDLLNRIFVSRVIPMIAIFFVSLVNIFISAVRQREYGLMAISIALMVLYITVFLQTTVKYISFRRKVNRT